MLMLEAGQLKDLSRLLRAARRGRLEIRIDLTHLKRVGNQQPGALARMAVQRLPGRKGARLPAGAGARRGSCHALRIGAGGWDLARARAAGAGEDRLAGHGLLRRLFSAHLETYRSHPSRPPQPRSALVGSRRSARQGHTTSGMPVRVQAPDGSTRDSARHGHMKSGGPFGRTRQPAPDAACGFVLRRDGRNRGHQMRCGGNIIGQHPINERRRMAWPASLLCRPYSDWS